MPSLRSQQRQTRLSFTPVPSSSPARASQPEAIRDRAAFVRLTESPSKKQRSPLDGDEGSPKPYGLLTPRATNRPMGGSSRASRLGSRRDGSKQSAFMGGSASSPIASKSNSASKRKVVVLSDDSESYSDAAPTSQVTAREASSPEPEPQARSTSRRKMIIDSDDDGADSDPASSPPAKTPSKPLKRKVRVIESDDDASGSDNTAEVTRSSKRQRLSAHPSQRSEVQADLDEDLEFLGDANNSAALQRAPASSQKQTRLSALEQLRQKRLRNASSQPSADPASSPPRITQEDDSLLGEDEDAIYEYVALGPEDDFIVEDDEAPVMLPGPFSQLHKQKSKDLFRYAVEWMVSKKINPAFAMTDEVYDVAFRRLNDFVHGMGGSKFHSSAWTPAFGRSLKGRPTLEDVQTGASPLYDRCDACNRSNHPATWQVRFLGKTYNKDTMEEDEEESSEEDDDDDSIPRRERDVPSEGTTYHIGKFCMRNARTAHAFAHWKYHLNEWVVDHLKETGELSPDKIVKRDGWTTKRRRKEAYRIVDAMGRGGEIKRLYRDFKNEIDTAQLANNSSNHHRSYSP